MAEDTILSQLVPFRKDIFVAKKEGRYLSECLGQGKRQGVQGMSVWKGQGWKGKGMGGARWRGGRCIVACCGR